VKVEFVRTSLDDAENNEVIAHYCLGDIVACEEE